MDIKKKAIKMMRDFYLAEEKKEVALEIKNDFGYFDILDYLKGIRAEINKMIEDIIEDQNWEKGNVKGHEGGERYQKKDMKKSKEKAICIDCYYYKN